jgi:hypothetical protein
LFISRLPACKYSCIRNLSSAYQTQRRKNGMQSRSRCNIFNSFGNALLFRYIYKGRLVKISENIVFLFYKEIYMKYLILYNKKLYMNAQLRHTQIRIHKTKMNVNQYQRLVWFTVFNVTFNHISIKSWRSVLLMELVSSFELTTLVVIGTDCTGSYKSNYNTIMTTTVPYIKENHTQK